MHKIEIDRLKNLLVIHLNGFHSANRESFVFDIEKAAARLLHDFSCIIVLSKYTLVSAKDLQDIENLLYAYGLKKIVYVDQPGLSAVDQADELCCTSIDIEGCRVSTLEEAENYLTGHIGRQSIKEDSGR